MQYMLLGEERIKADKLTEWKFSQNAYLHGKSFFSDSASVIETMNAQFSGPDTSPFRGLKMDTGANISSVIS